MQARETRARGKRPAPPLTHEHGHLDSHPRPAPLHQPHFYVMSAAATHLAKAKAEGGSDAVMEDLDDWCARSSRAPAIATGKHISRYCKENAFPGLASCLYGLTQSVNAEYPVHEHVRRRIRIFKTTQKLLSDEAWPNLILTAPPEVRKLCMQHALNLPPRSDAEVELEANRAKDWLVNVLRNQSQLLSREHGLRMLHSAVEKELMGAKDRWSDMEKLYMALASNDAPEPTTRLRTAFLLVLRLNFADRLADVKQLATQRCAAIELAASMDADIHKVRERIFDRMRNVKVDHFACAIYLKTLRLRPDIVDDNEGCCPVCQNSYTDLAANTPQELLADFPVRIQHCGHIIGKSCLERWMSTPKIDEAKYPHRTCPLCRTKIEGVAGPKMPMGLQKHVQTDRRATETFRYLAENWDVELEECLEVIAAYMSEEIACEEVLNLIRQAKELIGMDYDDDEEKKLRANLDELNKEKRAWGFRNNVFWKQLRDEWMDGGVVRKE